MSLICVFWLTVNNLQYPCCTDGLHWGWKKMILSNQNGNLLFSSGLYINTKNYTVMAAVNKTAAHLKMKRQGSLQWLAATRVRGCSKQWRRLVFRNILIFQ